MPRVRVEICVEGWEAAEAAILGGADRIELCATDSLAVEGLTPDLAAMTARWTLRATRTPVHVLIRPRPESFVYDRAEVEAMGASIDAARAFGAAGVVFGLTRNDGTIDTVSTAELVARAHPMDVTFHKAFDTLRDPFQGLETLIGLGVARVLTSGGAASAREGASTLEALVAQARGRIVIMAGGRIRAADLATLLASGVTEVHAATAVMVEGRVDPGAVARFIADVREAERQTDSLQDRTRA